MLSEAHQFQFERSPSVWTTSVRGFTAPLTTLHIYRKEQLHHQQEHVMFILPDQEEFTRESEIRCGAGHSNKYYSVDSIDGTNSYDLHNIKYI